MNKLTAVTLEVSGLTCPKNMSVRIKTFPSPSIGVGAFSVEPSPDIALYKCTCSKTNIKNCIV
jgi:hypothetical protein